MEDENPTPSLSHISLQIARINPSTGSAYSNPIRLEECNENDENNSNNNNNNNNDDEDEDEDEDYHNDESIPIVDSLNELLENVNENENPQSKGAESEAQVEADIHNKKESLSNSSSSVVTKSVSDDTTEKSASEQHQEDMYYADHQYPYDESRSRSHVSSFEDAHPHEEEQQEEQEWTHEDHDRSPDMTSYHRSKEERRKQRQLAYERAERRRLNKCMYFAVLILLLEVAAGTIAVMYYQELIECCGRSIFASTDTNGDISSGGSGESESETGNEIDDEVIAERWNIIFYWVGISYLIVIILIEIPTLVIATEPLFIFNPMVGFLLAMHMMYITDTKTAYIIYGLETAAMVGQSIVLVQMHRSPELCIHSILNYTLCGLVIFMLVRLTEQGGYCIVDDRIQSIFSISTCNIQCIDDASCFRCDADTSSCFIQFTN
jgi:hypothetical protein